MKALCWYGTQDVRVKTVPDPKILNPRDAIVRITSTAICGSDLHIYNGYIPTMDKGDILGHEFMGEVMETGKENGTLKRGDRVVVPFTIACGKCFYCKDQMWSLCDNSNPNRQMAETLYGFSGSGLFGYSHLYGGYAGGQAEYARVPFADVGCIRIPDDLSDDQVLFLSDILPTGYMAAENCGIREGDTVAVWGCGPVGQFAIKSAYMLGAAQVIAIDHIPERLEMARFHAKAEAINYEDVNIVDELKKRTGDVARMLASMRSAWKPTARLSIHCTTMRSRRFDSGRTVRTCCVKPYKHVERVERSRFRVFMVVSWTKFPSVPRSQRG